MDIWTSKEPDKRPPPHVYSYFLTPETPSEIENGFNPNHPLSIYLDDYLTHHPNLQSRDCKFQNLLQRIARSSFHHIIFNKWKTGTYIFTTENSAEILSRAKTFIFQHLSRNHQDLKIYHKFVQVTLKLICEFVNDG